MRPVRICMLRQQVDLLSFSHEIRYFSFGVGAVLRRSDANGPVISGSRGAQKHHVAQAPAAVPFQAALAHDVFGSHEKAAPQKVYSSQVGGSSGSCVDMLPGLLAVFGFSPWVL